ncbi:MAG: hypothetical protein EA374_03635 [Acholeplasmatales bacterium]|nr:MAG: hypothetical protein EA374_03635 [Acholeplasmatales bacterium]
MKKLFAILLISLAAITALEVIAQDSDDYGVDLALGRRVVSSPHTDSNYNVRALDGRTDTRYASIEQDDVFFYVNLGSVEKIGKVLIDWEAAYAARYEVKVSNDAENWTTVAIVENDAQTIDEIVFPRLIEAQYVKFRGVERATPWGYSFHRFEVYGPKNLAAGGTVVEVSSHENADVHNQQNMLDNRADTRWASEQADDQFAIFDMEAVHAFDLIKIRWEVSKARNFELYALDDLERVDAPGREDEDWVRIADSAVGLGEVDAMSVNLREARYLKLELIQRETSEETKRTGRFPWESTFSIYSFEVYHWDAIDAVPIGHVHEFSQNSPAWTAMNNIVLYEELLLAPVGYSIWADGVVTDLASIADGDIPGFESYAAYNPAVIYDDEREIFHMLYRSQLPDNFSQFYGPKPPLGRMSSMSYAYSHDGYNFTRGDNNPVVWPTLPEEDGGGIEDPRIIRVRNDENRGGLTTYYITGTMYNNQTTRQGIIYTHDFVTYHKVGDLAPDYPLPLKSGYYLTDPYGDAVKINDPRPGHTGMVYMIYIKDGGYARIGFTDDLIRIEAEDIIDVETHGFGFNHIEALTGGNESCMAITNIYGPDDEDIYLLYGGPGLSDPDIMNQQFSANGWFYALGALKATKSNPFELTNITFDLDEPSMHPTDTNKWDYGMFDKCMFADQMIRFGNTWKMYYGAGDTFTHLATSRADYGSGVARFSLTDTHLRANTYALNKAFGGDKMPIGIEFVAYVHDLDGQLIDEVVISYDVPHFSQLEMGVYDRGIAIELNIELTTLPEQYYVQAFVRDALTGEILNNVSTHTVIVAVVNRTLK